MVGLLVVVGQVGLESLVGARGTRGMVGLGGLVDINRRSGMSRCFRKSSEVWLHFLLQNSCSFPASSLFLI